MCRPLKLQRSSLDVGRSAFGSFVLLYPRFPTAFEPEHVRNLRFLAQSLRYFAGEIATLRTAIDDDLFPLRPRRQKLRQQFIPPIFVQRKRAGNMIARELVIRPSIHPNDIPAP